jgi:hypothetical protein
MASDATLAVVSDGWTHHHALIVRALQDLTPEQRGLRAAGGQWAIWLAGHVAAVRIYYFHDWIGEGGPSVREPFRVAHTTVPDLPLEDAGWEDDEMHTVMRPSWSTGSP